MAKTKMRDIVVILPGITGSVLQKDGKDIWAISGQAAWAFLKTRGGSSQQLKINHHDDPEVEDWGDGIQATRLVADAHLVPGLVKIDGYTSTAKVITDRFDVIRGNIYEDKPANFFDFPYDWRRDNRANAKILKRLLDLRLKQWREHTGLKDAKVILLAHSMGGLISRYYLEVLEGWRDCKALFTFGTPYRGSVKAVDFLANGYKKLFLDLTEVMRTFPSVYQLLPIYKMLKVNNQYWRIAEAPIELPNIIKARAQDALKFHREIENAVNSHCNDEEYRKSYKTIPMVGTKQPTLQSTTLIDDRLEANFELPEWIDSNLDDGDDTVPYLSAIPLELSDEYRETYIAETHGSIQNHSRVLQELRDRIKGMQVQGLGAVRGPEVSPEAAERSAISLTLDDLYLADEPVEMRARLINFHRNPKGIQAQIQSIVGGDTQKLDFQQKSEKEWVLTVGDLSPGLYRLTVQTGSYSSEAPTPVHDLFEVVN